MAGRALIVDDHPIIRDALVSSLVSLEVFEQVETTESFADLLQLLEQDASYRLLILDLSLADVSGPDGMVYVREHYPELPVIVFSANDSSEVISRCFEHGVHGFVSKNTSMEIFISAIRIVLAGGIYIPPAAVGMSTEPRDEPGKVQFSPKQREVFAQLMQGVPNKVIGKRLGLAEGTVKSHLHSIYKILGVASRAQAIVKAQQLGIEA